MTNPASASEYTAPVQTLRVVGGLGAISQFTESETQFWTRDLARASHGKYSAEIVAFDRAGIPGPEMLRLVQLGVVPFGTALLSNISARNPELAAPDLAGMNPSMDSLRRNLAAYRPFLQKTLREKMGIELLAIYTYPAQVLFCKARFSQLGDLAGRRVRVSSATQSDYVSALGGIPVLVALSQTVSNIESGNTECAITSAVSGNIIGLPAHTHYLYTMPVTWGLSLFIANRAAWHALPTDLRQLLERELPDLERRIWSNSERETREGPQCSQGLASCVGAPGGHMEVITPSASDEVRRQQVFAATVLPHWLQRCQGDCAQVWNQTIGRTLGLATFAPGTAP